MSNHLRAFVRYNNNGKVVPSGMVFAAHPPKTGKWKEIPITFCCSTIPFPTVSSNNKELKAYVRYDGQNKLVPGGPILSRSKPKVGNWVEINDNLCCQPSSAKCGAPYFINYLETGINFYGTKAPSTTVIDSQCNMITVFDAGYDLVGTDFTYRQLIIKYDKDGNTLWQKLNQITIENFPNLGIPSTSPVNIALDTNDNIYISDRLGLFKLNTTDGSLIWSRTFFKSFAFAFLNSYAGIHFNNNGELFFCTTSVIDVPSACNFPGGCTISSYYAKTYIVKINPLTGNAITEKTLYLDQSSDPTFYWINGVSGYSTPYSDSSGNIYIDTYYGRCADCFPVPLSTTYKFDSNLNYISNYSLDTYPDYNNSFLNTQVDKNYNRYTLYEVPSLATDPTKYNCLVIKLNDLGILQWSKLIQGDSLVNDMVNVGIATDSNGNTFIFTCDYGAVGRIIKLDTNGNILWATEITDTVGDGQIYSYIYANNANQLSISNDVLMLVCTTMDNFSVVYKMPVDVQILGNYGTATFTDVTFLYSRTDVPVTISDTINPLVEVTASNEYQTNLVLSSYIEIPTLEYTFSTVSL